MTPTPLSLEALDRIDDACQRCEKCWQRGEVPVLETYLAQAQSLEETAALLRELLHLDIEYRRRRGETLEVEALIHRFPGHETLISELVGSQNLTTPSPAHNPTWRRDGLTPPAPLRVEIPGYDEPRLIGHGGMGIVYLARHQRLNRPVAVKMLALLAATEGGMRRFRAEAEAIARLSHRGIVQIFEVGEHHARPYLALEYVSGGSLRDRLRQGMPEIREAARLIASLARAMHHAHAHGIVHRDLKPANVLLTETGEPKIADFGLAKLANSSEHHTRTGEVMGTPQYMAPEQAKGSSELVGPASDVYALGAILYECLAGRPPFQAESPLQILHLLSTTDPIPLTRIRPRLPADLESICLKCLEKDPPQRYGSAEALAEDLERFLRGDPVRARPLGTAARTWRWCVRRPVSAALTLLIMVLVSVGLPLLAGLYTRAERSASYARLAQEQAELAQKDTDRLRREAELQVARLWNEQATTLMDQGDSLGALVWGTLAWQRECREDLMTPDSADAERLERFHRRRSFAILQQAPALARIWPLQGKVDHASFLTEQTLLTRNLEGQVHRWDARRGERLPGPIWGDERTTPLMQVTDEGVSFSPITNPGNPSQILVRLIDHNTNAITATFTIPESWKLRACGEAGLLRDRSLAYLLYFNLADEVCLGFLDVVSGTCLPETPHNLGLLRVKFEAMDRRKAFWTNKNRLVTLPGEVHIYDPKSTSPPLRLSHPSPVRIAAVSPDDQRLATGLETGLVYFWDMNTGRSLGTGPRHAGRLNALAFDRSGRVLLSASEDGTARLWDVRQNRLIVDGPIHTGPIRVACFSPDERWVLTGSEDGAVRIWNAATGALVFPILQHGGAVQEAVFRREAHEVFVAAATPEGGSLGRTWDLTGARPTNKLLARHRDGATRVAFSRDGQKLVSAGEDGTVQIWDPNKGQPLGPTLRGINPVTHVSWDDEGRYLAVVSQKELQLWDAFQGTPLTRPFGGHLGVSNGVDDVRFMPGTKLVAISFIDHVNGFDLSTKLDRSQFRHLGLQRVILAPEGPIGAGVAGSSLVTFDLPGLTLRHTLTLPASPAEMAFDRSGGRLAVVGVFGLQVWDTARGQLFLKGVSGLGNCRQVRFSRDGRSLLTVDEQGRGLVFDATTGERQGRPCALGGTTLFAAFEASGDALVTVRQDGQARVWDWRTGLPLTPPLWHGAPVRGADLSPQGLLAVAGQDGWVRVWQLPQSDLRPRETLTFLGSLLAGRQPHEGESALAGMAYERLREERAGVQGEPEVNYSHPERLFDWHRRQALESQRERHWLGACFHLAQALRFKPEDPGLLQIQAECLEQAGRWAEAATALTHLMQRQPDEVGLLEVRARVYTTGGEWEKALTDLHNPRLARDDTGARALEEALVLARLGKSAEAESAFQRAQNAALDVSHRFALHGEDRLLKIAAGEALWAPALHDLSGLPRPEDQTAAFRERWRSLQRLRETPERSTLEWRACGLISTVLGETKRAESEYAEVISRSPKDAEALRGLVWCAIRKQAWGESLALVQKAQDATPKDGSLAHLQAVINIQKGDIRAALPALTKAIALGADHPQARRRRGWIHLLLGNLAQAEEDLAAAVRQDEGRDYYTLGMLAEVLARREKWLESGTLFREVMRRTGFTGRAAPAARAAFLKAGRPDLAEEVVENNLKPFGVGQITLSALNLHLWTAVLVEKPPPSLQEWEKRLEVFLTQEAQPNHAILNTAGAVLYRLKRPKEAHLWLEKAISKSKGTMWDYLFLALVFIDLDKHDEAQASLKKATEWLDRRKQGQITEFPQPLRWLERVEGEVLFAEAQKRLAQRP